MTTRPRARQSAMVQRPRLRHAEKLTSLTVAVLSAIYGPAALADNTAAPVSDSSEATPSLEEVIVTASRREASAQDLPISITAVTGATLEENGVEDIAQLGRSMAGVNVTDKGPFGGVNGSTLIIRGLNSEGTGGQLGLATPVVPPVATYVDDTPLFVNLRLQDIDHVEILRGPQGTLYGSGSLGGTIRFVQNAPDPKAFDAKAEVGMSDTQHTHAPNEEASGMLNLPLGDTLAVRLNAGWSYDAGFINDPNLYVLDSSGAPVSAQPGNVFSPPEKYSQNGVNYYDYKNARLATLWKPNEQFKAELTYYYQLNIAGGFPSTATSGAAYNQPISPLTQSTLPTGGYTNPTYLSQLYPSAVPAGVDSLSSAENAMDHASDKVDLGALTLDYDMGFATLTSDTSWAHHNNTSSDDLTAIYTNFFFFQNLYGQDPRTLVVGRDQLDDRIVSQELRLASKAGGFFDWVGGLFYKDQKTYIQEHEYDPGYNSFYNGCNALGYAPPDNTELTPSYCGFGEYGPETGATSIVGIPLVLDQTYIGDFHTHFQDLAAFGELTAHLTKDWSLTGGTRVFDQRLSQSQQTGLLFDGPGFAANESLSDSWRKALWKVNTAYQLDKTNLVYATWSQGFRRGGVNALPPSELGGSYVTPASLTKLQPDTADNYEVGVKGEIANRLRYSAAIYEIQWHNIQEGVQLTPLVLPAALNIGDAYSQGVEMELYGVITQHFSAQVDYTYDRTRLTSLSPLFVSPNVSVPPPAIGSALPGTPKNSLAVDLEYGHVAIGPGELRYAINAHYQSSLLPALSATAPIVAGYTMLDTRLTYTLPHWTATVYCTNLTNNLGINSYSDPAIYGNRDQAVVSQPRTIGFTVGYSFKGY